MKHLRKFNESNNNFMTLNEIKERLCYYDVRNPNNTLDEDAQREFDEDTERECFCDNCFYGRTELAEELLKYYHH